MGKNNKRNIASDLTTRGKSIQALARREGTPVNQQAELTGLLSKIAPADELPPSLLQVLAEVLDFVENLESTQVPPAAKFDVSGN